MSKNENWLGIKAEYITHLSLIYTTTTNNIFPSKQQMQSEVAISSHRSILCVCGCHFEHKLRGRVKILIWSSFFLARQHCAVSAVVSYQLHIYARTHTNTQPHKIKIKLRSCIKYCADYNLLSYDGDYKDCFILQSNCMCS